MYTQIQEQSHDNHLSKAANRVNHVNNKITEWLKLNEANQTDKQTNKQTNKTGYSTRAVHTHVRGVFLKGTVTKQTTTK